MSTLFDPRVMSADVPFAVFILVLFGALFVLILVLIVGQVRTNARLHDLTYPVYDHAVKEAEHKANRLLAEAQEKSRAVLAAAEMEAGRVLGAREHDGERLLAEYEKRLAELSHKHEAALGTYANEAEHVFGALRASFKESVASIEAGLHREVDVFATETKAARARLEDETKRLVTEQLTREVAAVREGLQSYRRERMKLIERDIVSVVQQAVAIVIRRELPLKDHADMVVEALEEAKREGTLV